jgi:hypothetical protein
MHEVAPETPMSHDIVSLYSYLGGAHHHGGTVCLRELSYFYRQWSAL